MGPGSGLFMIKIADEYDELAALRMQTILSAGSLGNSLLALRAELRVDKADAYLPLVPPNNLAKAAHLALRSKRQHKVVRDFVVSQWSDGRPTIGDILYIALDGGARSPRDPALPRYLRSPGSPQFSARTEITNYHHFLHRPIFFTVRICKIIKER
jgi:hypothetical protein